MLLHLKGALTSTQVEWLLQTIAVPFQDGRATAAGDAAEVKHNLEAPVEHEATARAGQLLKDLLLKNHRFVWAAQPRRFSDVIFNRYEATMRYGRHLDGTIMSGRGSPLRSDVSVSVFLSSASEYEGGELEMDSDWGSTSCKGDLGDVVIYPSSTLHQVKAVRSGVRRTAVFWVQSMVPDPARRRILFDLAVVVGDCEKKPVDPEMATTLRKSYGNLLRMWAEV